MRLLNILTIFIISSTCFAQDSNLEILLRSGTFTPNNEFVLEDFSANSPSIFNGRYYRFMQFAVLPSTKQKQKMENSGIHFIPIKMNTKFYLFSILLYFINFKSVKLKICRPTDCFLECCQS